MTQTKIYASRKGSKIAPKPNSTSDPKPNPNPNRGAIFLIGKTHKKRQRRQFFWLLHTKYCRQLLRHCRISPLIPHAEKRIIRNIC